MSDEEGNLGAERRDAVTLVLTARERSLYTALLDKAPPLGRMYLGAIVVLRDSANPERLVLAAHAMRELMEKLPETLAVPTTAQRESLKGKVREVEGLWLGARQSSRCHVNGDWEGEVDRPLRRLLRRLAAFFEWFNEHMPRRRDELGRTLERLDPTGRRLPQPLQHLNIDAWELTHDFFQAVAHHRKEPAEEEFDKWLHAAEGFLLDRLRPRTFEDFRSIDALIKEGETRAHS